MSELRSRSRPRPGRAFVLLAVALVAGTLLGAAPLGSTTPAGAACAAQNRTLGGAFVGEDNRTISGFVGVHLFNSQGQHIGLDGCPAGLGQYPVYDCINATWNPNAGCFFTRDVNGGGSGDERTWSISGVPANAAYAVAEAYPKSSTGDPSGLYGGWTDYRRYGGALRWNIPISTSAHIVLPLNCSAGGDGGGISATVTIGGQPADVYYAVAFSRAGEGNVPIQGFMASNDAWRGGFNIAALEQGQRYSLEINLRDGRRFWFENDYGYGIPVSACATTRRTLELDPWTGRAVDRSGLASGPTGADMGGQRNVFYRGSDGALWGLVDGTTLQTPYSLGGVIVGEPDATSWGFGRTDVVVRGGDGQVWWNYYDSRLGRWRGFLPLGGGTNYSPAVVSWGSGRLDVVITGLDGQLWHKSTSDANQNGANWSGWEPLGGRLSSSPDVASWGVNRLDIVARGVEGSVWHLVWHNGWYPWEYLGGSIAGGPSVSSSAYNRLDIAAYAGGNRVYFLRWNGGGYDPWSWLAGGLTDAEPDIAAYGGRTTVYVRGADGAVWRIARQGADGAWGTWGFIPI